MCDDTKTNEDDACYPSDITRGQSWTLAEIFGRHMEGSCLVEDVASICLHVPEDRETLSPPDAIEEREDAGDSRCFIINPTEPFEMVLSHLGPQTFNAHASPALYASRSIIGHGQERGGVQSLLTNPSTTEAIDFIYFESLPWFMKPYLHTLKARISTSPHHDSSIVKDTFYRPGLDRQRGTQLEILMSVPANVTVVLSYEFDKAILRYTEYPPDANRGFDIAPAVLRLFPSPSESSAHAQPTYIRTSSLLLPLPTPDFSMPYNVIILTSTVIALAFGSIFNLLVRRFVSADEVEGWDLNVVKARLRGRLIILRDRIFGKRVLKKE